VAWALSIAKTMSELPHSRCARCASPSVQRIPLMRKYFPHEDWFRCDSCDHLFTRPVPAGIVTGPEERLPRSRFSGERVVWDD